MWFIGGVCGDEIKFMDKSNVFVVYIEDVIIVIYNNIIIIIWKTNSFWSSLFKDYKWLD